MKWFIMVIKNAFNFSDRARRKEYWMFALMNFIFTVVLAILDVVLTLNVIEGMGILVGLYTILIIIPSLSVTVRRLHDTGKSGWWVLLPLIPIIGTIVLLVFTVQDSDPSENAYGLNPKAVA